MATEERSTNSLNALTANIGRVTGSSIFLIATRRLPTESSADLDKSNFSARCKIYLVDTSIFANPPNPARKDDVVVSI